jgi:ribosomal-protein-alanine N-acetyltransferase
MLTIDNLRIEEINEVLKIEKICFGENWLSTPFEREINKDECIYIVAKYNNKIVGYAGAWIIIDEIHVTIMAVLPEYRKNKIGQKLLKNLLIKGIEKGGKWATLEVKESNIPAQKLYEKFNFCIKGRRRKYYQQDQEDALIMWTEEINNKEYKDFLYNID